MLKKILSITGRPGLFELVNQGKNCLIVESIAPDKKRLPVFNHEKVMSLGDVAIYTTGDEVPLNQVFENIKAKFDGKTVDIKELEKTGKIRGTFAEILPEYDDERVRTSDMKKVFSWYNILVNNGKDDFSVVELNEEAPEEEKAEQE